MNEEILKRLDLLAAKLGVTAQYLWGVLLKQARLEAIRDAVLVMLSFGVVAACACWAHYVFSRECTCERDSLIREGSGVVAAILFIVFTVVGFVALASLPTELFNPEYFALREILGAGR